MITLKPLTRTWVQPWVVFATYPLGAFLQFFLIRLGAPQWLYVLLPFLVTFLDPIVLISDPFFFFGAMAFMKLFMFLRMIDIGLLPPWKVRTWSFQEYVEYVYTFYTKKDAVDRKQKKLKIGSPNRVLPSQRTPGYYVQLSIRLWLYYLIYNVLIWYMETYLVNERPPARHLANLFDLHELFGCFVFGSTLCVMLTLNYTLLFHAVAIIFKTPFEPIMNNPFVSTSFRDFWSNRWNVVIKENLHRLGFQPAMALLKSFTPNKIKNWKPPAWHALIGAMNAFLVSGLIHEWLNFVLLEEPTEWEHLIFFLLQGLVTAAELFFGRFTKRVLGRDLVNDVPIWISVPRTYLLFLWMSPLFLNPWARDKLLHRMRIPTLMDIPKLIKTGDF